MPAPGPGDQEVWGGTPGAGIPGGIRRANTVRGGFRGRPRANTVRGGFRGRPRANTVRSRMRIALTALTPQGPADVIVSGDDGATAGQVAEALHEAFVPKEHLAPVIMHPRAGQVRVAGLAAARPVLWAGGQQVPPDMPAARALRDGAVVTTIERAAAATSLAEPGGVAELRVIGGPDAGTVHR